MRRRLGLAAGAMAVVTLLGACLPDTVTISYRPALSDRHRYRVEVEAESVIRLQSRPARRTSSEFVLDVEHEVLNVAERSTEVAVTIRPRGQEGAPQQLVVTLDRGAQAVEVRRVEGIPAAVLGDLGLSELFPAAAGSPPDRPLRPGETWKIDEPLNLARTDRTRLRGMGRLAELGVMDGRETATVTALYRLPVRRSDARDLDVLDGVQTTRARTTHDLKDGVVLRAEAVTTARFDVVLRPPPGEMASSVVGTLTVKVSSKTRRL